MSGGDRATLTPGDDVVGNSSFHDLSRWEWTYRPAIDLSGEGNTASHNTIRALPHAAILYGGNDHLIDLNDISRACRFSSDAAAIYAGRDGGARGNVIKNNFIHDVSAWFQGDGVHGIDLDDCLSSVRVAGNVLYRITGFGILHGGGRDDVMVGNKKISRPPSHWLKPEGAVLDRNVSFDNGAWTQGSAETHAAYADIRDNLVGVDPQFVDERTLDSNLAPTSPALAIPGFVPIPFSDIGVKP